MKIVDIGPLSWIERFVWRRLRATPSSARSILRVLMTVLKGSVSDQIWVRAGHMTYLSLLHLVPLGALALSISSRLGWKGLLERWLQERLSPTAPELAANLVAAMDRFDVVAIGYVGLVAIIIAGVLALSQLEADLGEIWHAHSARGWWHRSLLYPLVIVLGPTIVALVLALGAVAEVRTSLWITSLNDFGAFGQWLYRWFTQVPVIFQIIPYVLTWVLLTGLYYLVSSAPIRFRAAAAGGVFAGIVWQGAQKVYVNFQFASGTYREIWGYLAQIPLLLLWMYFSWLILYLGAEIVFAWQYRRAFMPKWPLTADCPATLEARAVLEVATATLKDSASESNGVSASTISVLGSIPWPLINHIATRMTDLSLLSARRTAPGYIYHANESLKRLTVGELLMKFRDPVGDSQLAGLDRNTSLLAVAGIADTTDEVTSSTDPGQ